MGLGSTFFLLTITGMAATKKVYVGTSEVSITPKRPVALEGSFALRISDGIQSPIMASVIIVESRENQKVSNLLQQRTDIFHHRRERWTWSKLSMLRKFM